MQYTVCMDESGRFEENEDKARFLGGCIYKGDDFANEENRLRAIMTATAKIITEKLHKLYPGDTTEVVFPGSFHMSDLKVKNSQGNLEKVQNKDQIRDIKNMILNCVIYYLTGTWRADSERRLEQNDIDADPDFSKALRERKTKGSYECFMMIDPSGKAKSFESNRIWDRFNMTRLSSPGNLYVRLATLTVSKMVFYFMRPEMKKIQFMLASRTPYVEEAGAQAVRALYPVDENGKRTYYSLINESTFVTCLQNQIYEGKDVLETTPTEVAFQVKELEYTEGGSTSPFMYLSDIICLYLQRILYGRGNYENFQADAKVLNRVEQSLGDRGLPVNIWIYEPMDIEWKLALDALAEGELAEALDHLYTIKMDKESASGVYYTNHWVPLALDWINKKYMGGENVPASGIYSAKTVEKKLPGFVSRAEELSAAKDNERAKWIAENLIKVMKARKIQNGSLWYRLYDVLLRCYNHCGDLQGTEYCIQMLNVYCASVSDEIFMSSVNRALQWYFNRFSYDRIVEICKKIAQFGEKKIALTRDQITELRPMIAGFDADMELAAPAVQSRSLGVLYSSIGQALAFLERTQEADSYFEKAIAQFEKNGRDYNQTLSYRLHNLIEGKNEEKYQEHAKELFTNDFSRVPLRETKVIFNFDDLNKVRFDLYLWMKAMTVFQWEGNKFKTSVKRVAEAIFHDLKNPEMKEHPWTLTLKYIYLYGKKTGCVSDEILQGIFHKLMETDVDIADKIRKKRWTTLEAVNGAAVLDVLEEGDNSGFASMYARFMALRDQDIWPDLNTENVGQMKEKLKGYMTYMYT